MALALLAACTGARKDDARSGYRAIPAERPGGGPEAAAFFGEDVVHQIGLSFGPEGEAALLAGAGDTRPAFVAAQLRVDGRDIGSVGVRWKGGPAARAACRRDDRAVCAKPSLKIKIDAHQPALRLHGQRRLNLHGFDLDRPDGGDPSLAREWLGFQLFAAMGIPAPRTVPAVLIVDGRMLGVYLVVEEIDGRFTADRWPGHGDGNLYEDVWPGALAPGAAERALRTNRRRADHRGVEVLDNLVRAAAPADLARVVDEWLDLDHLARHLVADEAMRNRRGVRALGCAGATCVGRNFFFYQDERQDRLWLLPWDLGATFQLFDPHWRVPVWTAPPTACAQRHLGDDGQTRQAGGCDRLLGGVVALGGDALASSRQRLREAWTALQPAARVVRLARLLEPHVKVDDRGPGLPAWRLALRALDRDLAIIAAGLGEAPERAPEGGETLALLRNTFEGVDRSVFLTRTRFAGGRRTGALHDLNRDQPIGGTQDVLLTFELANQLGADGAPQRYSQAAALRLPFRSGTTLAEAQRIAFSWKSATARELGLVIEGARGRIAAAVSARAGLGDYVVEIANLGAEGLADADRAAILAAPAALVLEVHASGLVDGLLPAGRSDAGTAQLDNLVIQ